MTFLLWLMRSTVYTPSPETRLRKCYCGLLSSLAKNPLESGLRSVPPKVSKPPNLVRMGSRGRLQGTATLPIHHPLSLYLQNTGSAQQPCGESGREESAHQAGGQSGAPGTAPDREAQRDKWRKGEQQVKVLGGNPVCAYH